ncbi:hypothetical protein Q3G72_001744 [Acer saccharum]|nr:hypothetical protein Q3G72_001744 [Acer saccharum]
MVTVSFVLQFLGFNGSSGFNVVYNAMLFLQLPCSQVPPRYHMDEDLLILCVVNQLQRLGLAEHYIKEIEEVLA